MHAHALSHADRHLSCLDTLQTLAEKAAWDLSKKHGFELVTINPVFVFGPVLSSRADATSVLMMKVIIGLMLSMNTIATQHLLHGSTHMVLWHPPEIVCKHFIAHRILNIM